MQELSTSIQSIRQSTREIVRELNVLKGAFRDTGLSYSQCHALFELSQHKVLNLLELATILQLDKSTASRVMKNLVGKDLVKIEVNITDRRQKIFSLTTAGLNVVQNNNYLADSQVEQALSLLDTTELTITLEGMKLYAKALKRSRLQTQFTIRRIQKKDNEQVARLIREVMTEYGATSPGHSINDPEVVQMFEAYNLDNAHFFVLTQQEQIVGCGGIMHLKDAAPEICELRKMYFRPQARGMGMGKKMLQQCLEKAKELGYQQCYLETAENMWQANLLYQKMGFKKLPHAMGNTGHCACEVWYLKDLK